MKASQHSYAGRKGRWVQSPLLVLAVHWLFQGMFYMDRTERSFKLLLDVILAVPCFLLFRRRFLPGVALPAALLTAHTANFLANGHLWGAMKHFGAVQTSWNDFNAEVQRLQERVNRQRYISFAGVYGSLARDEWSPSSDLDVRIVRAPGVASALSACWFALCERARALVVRFPLDIYVFDGVDRLAGMAEHGSALVLKGVGGSAIGQVER